MKLLKIIFLFSITIIPILLNAQNGKGKHEVGTDIITLTEQLFRFNQGEFYRPYSATYHLTYKYHFEGFSARIGVGGFSTGSEYNENYPEEIVVRKNAFFNYRLGIERQISIHKRWICYFGIDFKHTITNRYDDFRFQNGGWRYGNDTKNNSYGASPLFGIEFRLTERIALQTEANFLIYSELIKNQPLVKQISDTPSFDRPPTALETIRTSGTVFSAPNFLVLSIRL